LTGGFLPMAMTVAREPMYQSFLGPEMGTAFLHGHSYTANPLGCAAGLASLDLLLGEACQNRLSAIEAIHRARLDTLARRPDVGRTRLCGTIAAFDLLGRDDGYGGPVGRRIKALGLERGLLLRPLGNVLYLLPPYCLTDDQVHLAWDGIEAILDTLAG
jgi:adenosylmethionine-8-amino-7-oxononanoate aminotransferase